MKRLLTTSLVGALSLSLVACGSEDPPELPPEDTMILPSFDNTTAMAQTQGSTANVSTAAFAVGVVTIAVQAITIVPRAFLAGVLTAEGEADGDEWVWSKDFPLLGLNGTLRASGEEGALNLSMVVNGLREGIELDQFEWFTGEHRLTEGNWTLYDPELNAAVLTIDWERDSATEKTLVFTNVTAGDDGEGDTVTYTQSGTTATMTVVDQVDADMGTSTVTVEWDLEDGSGSFTENANTVCWDNFDNGQVDIPCS